MQAALNTINNAFVQMEDRSFNSSAVIDDVRYLAFESGVEKINPSSLLYSNSWFECCFSQDYAFHIRRFHIVGKFLSDFTVKLKEIEALEYNVTPRMKNFVRHKVVVDIATVSYPQESWTLRVEGQELKRVAVDSIVAFIVRPPHYK